VIVADAESVARVHTAHMRRSRVHCHDLAGYPRAVRRVITRKQ